MSPSVRLTAFDAQLVRGKVTLDEFALWVLSFVRLDLYDVYCMASVKSNVGR